MDNNFLNQPLSDTSQSSQGGSFLDMSLDSSQNSIPQDVRSAEQVTGNHDSDGLCERFVEQMAYGKTGLFPTAVSAWNHYATNGQAFQGVDQAPLGSLIYFAPDSSNQGAGHVAINAGNGEMVSATYNGVRQDKIADWIQKTGQQPLGFVPISEGQNAN